MIKVAHDLELVARRDCRADLGKRWGLNLTGIRRAEFEPLRGVDLDSVQEFPAHEFDARDKWLRRLDVPLDQRNAVYGWFEIAARQMLFERRSRPEQPHAQSLAGTIVLEDRRIPEPLRRLREILLAGDRQRLRCFDAAFGE